MLVDRLPVAVKGRPLLLGKDLDLKGRGHGKFILSFLCKYLGWVV